MALNLEIDQTFIAAAVSKSKTLTSLTSLQNPSDNHDAALMGD